MTVTSMVWIDFENAPQVWVLTPIIEHLRERGVRVVLTARDFSYTLALCKRMGHNVQVIGLPGAGQSKIDKVRRILARAARLYALMAGHRKQITLALSHGSRSQILAAHFLGIQVMALEDYEFTDQSLVRFVDRLLVPFPIDPGVWGRYAARVQHYPGLKEELYLCNFKPLENTVPELAETGRNKVLLRCESHWAHYHSDQSGILQETVLEYLAGREVHLILLPRDHAQAREVTDFCEQRGILCWTPEQVIDGPALIWHVDLVIGGGGTMTREAAVLGVPSYSFFAGRTGAVDRYLEDQGRLVRLDTITDVDKILVKKRSPVLPSISSSALNCVTGVVDDAVGV